jgi:hypothetical protein
MRTPLASRGSRIGIRQGAEVRLDVCLVTQGLPHDVEHLAERNLASFSARRSATHDPARRGIRGRAVRLDVEAGAADVHPQPAHGRWGQDQPRSRQPGPAGRDKGPEYSKFV